MWIPGLHSVRNTASYEVTAVQNPSEMAEESLCITPVYIGPNIQSVSYDHMHISPNSWIAN